MKDEATQKKLTAIMEKLSDKYKNPLESKKKSISSNPNYSTLSNVQRGK
jgi:hypothetical protein